MTGAGKSKRSRANRRRMSQEYLEHWEDRLPQAPKQEPYKKLGLPLVLLPFVLMFCGGCVATAPTATLLIAALAGLMWFGDVVVKEVKTESYWVVYWKAAPWLVGEEKSQAASRRKSVKELSAVASAISEQYPDVYPGRIRQVVPVVKSRPQSNEHVGVDMVSMTSKQFLQAGRNELKYIDEALVPVTFEDRFGAVSDWVRSQYGETAAISAMESSEENEESRKIQKAITERGKSVLARTITNTGTGLYSVKAVPTNESEVQSGAVAGQVVTIAGTVAASPAFTGGYITNSTQAETRAIVSHDTTTATLEGNITAWGNEDVLEWYDSWDSIQGACDQLFTDQGAGAFTVEQEIRLYDGTYNEDVDISSMAATPQYRFLMLAASGETAVVVSNNGLATHAIDFNGTESIVVGDFAITSTVGGGYGVYQSGEGGSIYNVDVTGSAGVRRGIRSATCYVTDCVFDDLEYGTLIAYHQDIRNCTYTDCVSAIRELGKMGVIGGCVFDTGTRALREFSGQGEPGIVFQPVVTNCTFYNFTSVLEDASGTGIGIVRCRFYNNIVHTATNVFLSPADAVLDSVLADYNTYYNCTNIASFGGSTYNMAAWQGLTDRYGNSPDANSITTDPGLTTPGSDHSLTAASTSRHAGIGSFAVCETGINAVAFDKWHPDKGAWSSGAGPNVSYGS